MKWDEIALVTIGSNNFFWTGSLEQFNQQYALQEQPHRLSCYLLLCTDASGGSVVIDNETIVLQQPGVICIKPNSVCSIHVHNAHVTCFTEDFFSLRYNSNVLYQFSFLAKGSGNYFPLEEIPFQKWQLLSGLMQQEFLHQYKCSGRVLRSYLNILLCSLDQGFSGNNHPERTNNRDEKIRTFETLLEAHYSKHKTPSFYAAQLHITTNYLNKLCKQFRHISSGELIRKRVTIEAQRLLYHTGQSVGEIADQLGFESASYFATFFKKHTGMSPESFRKHDNI
jgi:AraC family transcriptional activator of pobA